MLSVPVQFINPFIAAVKRICDETVKIPVTARPARLPSKDERLWKLYPLSAAIQLRSAVHGIIAISFSEPVALALASGLAQAHFEKFDDETRDALGEVANLIIGSAKKDLPVGLVTISTPTILPTYQMQLPTGLPCLLIPFEAGCGRFVMQMAIAAKSAQALTLAASAAAEAPAKAA